MGATAKHARAKSVLSMSAVHQVGACYTLTSAGALILLLYCQVFFIDLVACMACNCASKFEDEMDQLRCLLGA